MLEFIFLYFLFNQGPQRRRSQSDHYSERIEQTTEDESIEHLSKPGTPSDRADSNSRGGERSDVLGKIVQNLQLASGKDSSSSQPREGQSGASTTGGGTGAGDLQRSRHSSSDSSMASHTSAETDAKQSEVKFKYIFSIFFTFFHFFPLFFAFFSLFFTFFCFFSLTVHFASIFSLNFRIIYLRFRFKFLVFRIEVNHVKSGFFFASKRNEIFASISNFASEAKVRAHPSPVQAK